jgi:uncharacterized cupredoxin-like copper-binding protein
MRAPLRLRALAGISFVGLAAAACGTGSPTAAPTAAGPTTVKVTLQEWAVVPAQASVSAGSVKFEVTNSGPEDVHEFVVIKTDLEPGALPVDSTGAVTEEGAGMTVVDEIEDIPVGQTQELSVTLAAGKYVLVCNIYSAEEKEAHFAKGMRTAFEVKG